MAGDEFEIIVSLQKDPYIWYVYTQFPQYPQIHKDHNLIFPWLYQGVPL